MSNTETLESPLNAEDQLVVSLKSLKRYMLYAGSLDSYTSAVFHEENSVGDWIKADDIDELIVKMKSKRGKT